MQTANIMLSLAGDAGNQVPKYGVTASEIAVLQGIHGGGAVTDIEPAGDIKRSHREERARLLATYGKMRDGRDESPVSQLFPGAAARLFETLAEMELPPELYKAKTRVVPEHKADSPVEANVEQTAAESGDADGGEPDDGIEDMDPGAHEQESAPQTGENLFG